MQQKVIQIGNSLAVTLPNDFVKKSSIKAGQKVFVDTDVDIDVMQVRIKHNNVQSLTPEFKEWLDGISDKYGDLIKELATR